MQTSSLLPKLLAKENITIQHGNYSTAWFDIKNRVLGLPMWKDMGKDVNDLFIGHEVGHALETPFEGWHDSTETLKGCPRSYLNVIEDARIERKIQSRYPGLIACFNRGYSKLLENGFFGEMDSVDYDTVKLIDKINLKTKLGTRIEVPFSDEEVVFYNRAMTTQTFEEVVELVKDILAFTKENTPELINQPQPQPEESGEGSPEEQDPTQSGHDDYEKEEGNTEDSPSEEGNTEDSPSETSYEVPSEIEEQLEKLLKELKEQKDAEIEAELDEALSGVTSNGAANQDEDISVTDEIYRSKEESLLDVDDSGTQPIYADEINKEILDLAVIPYAKLKAARDEYQLLRPNGDPSVTREGFAKQMKLLKTNASFAVREFEMRKSAYQNTRATTAKTGTIDVNKLWSYKTSEDIFLQSTKLANAKNHGMMLLIDLSGSMSGSMSYVMDQVMHLIVFCKTTNIPFEVYGFTSTNPDLDYKAENLLYTNGHLDMDGLSMPLLCSSSLKKADYLDAMYSLYARTKCTHWTYDRHNLYEDWGSTPLNQALVVSHALIKKFKMKHQIEKMNFITFTDGDANRLTVAQRSNELTDDNRVDTTRDKIAIKIDGKIVNCSSRSGRRLTTALLLNMAKRYNTNNLGFFMAESSSDWRNRLYIMADALLQNSDDTRKDANQQYRQNKCATYNDVLGYNEYYLVKGGKNLETQEDEFSTEEDASNTSIRNAFKKYAKSKKLNKVLMTKFGKAVA